MNRLFILVFICMPTLCCVAQEQTIKLPDTNDRYARYVKQLEADSTDIDYADFRNSFLESKQFNKKGTNYNTLKKQLFTEVRNSNYNEVVRVCKEMLGIDYTSLYAHKYLQQTYKVLGDTANYQKYHDIEFGLLRSITGSGDGKTCDTGWHVTQIEEEYFILNMMGDTLKMQSIASGEKNACDKMEVTTETGETKTYYFEANKVFEKEMEMFKN